MKKPNWGLEDAVARIAARTTLTKTFIFLKKDVYKMIMKSRGQL